MKSKSTHYINNDEFKELVTDYIRLNYNDKGDWIERYENTMKTRCLKKPEKWPQIKDFIERRRKMYETRQLTKEDYQRYEKVAHEFCKALYKIAEGMLNTMKLQLDEEYDDMKHEAVMAGLKYSARFDEESNTSCFAYFTQVIKNAIILYIDKRKEEYDNGNVIPEYKMLDTRTVDQFQGEDYGEQG